MSRFVYIADTHMGANPMGYHQQPGYPERLDDILAALDAWIARTGGVEFILHGGDMVDAGTPENIAAAVDSFRLSVPVHLCLGNHDLTEVDSLREWLTTGRRFFPDGEPEFVLKVGGWRIDVVPNHWCERPYRWVDEQTPQFSPEQRQWLKTRRRHAPGGPRILATHAPARGLPTAQTGLDAPHHAPPPSFARSLGELTHAGAGIRCVLGAHNHMNMCVEDADIQYVTASALVEAPFDFKLFEADHDGLRMRTISLADGVGFPSEVNAGKAFVQGRQQDRAFELALVGTRKERK